MIKPVCPHCKIPLERQSHKGVFTYACPSCFGFSVHFGGLKKVMTLDQVVSLWNAGKAAAPGPVPCSHCRLPMKTVFAEPAELDLCDHCDLVWLDTGEWDDISRKKPPAAKAVDLPGPTQNETYGRLLLQLENAKEESKRRPFERLSIDNLGLLKCLGSIIGIPTEEENDSFLATPWITWGLILACVLVTIMTVGKEEWVLKNLSFMTDRSVPMMLVTAVTSFFVHGGPMHLLGNMYFLWIFGDNVEDHLGKGRYVLLLFTATLFGDALFGVLHPGVVPLVGASGGISGVVAYYLCRFPKRRFVVFWFFGFFAIPGALFGGLYLLKELFGAFAETAGASGGVAHLAHLGGAVVGVVFAYLLAPQRELASASKPV